jgi:DNA mismatch repair ATPase MutS
MIESIEFPTELIKKLSVAFQGVNHMSTTDKNILERINITTATPKCEKITEQLKSLQLKLNNFVFDLKHPRDKDTLQTLWNSKFKDISDFSVVTEKKIKEFEKLVPNSKLSKMGQTDLLKQIQILTNQLKKVEQIKHQISTERTGQLVSFTSELRDLVSDINPSAVTRIDRTIAMFDTLTSFAELAERERLSRPLVHNGQGFTVKSAWNISLDSKAKKRQEQLVGVDLCLDGPSRSVILSGEDGTGKTTSLMSAGHILILAQMGCFVPALKAEIGIADKLLCFTDNDALASRSQVVSLVIF